ncbi:hypothetical protein ACN20G_21905 [Streptomyces sp. BI20]|uniref:hypothetical protein n=1 Tax=Streptomyces sp. BI20 TaxID=3403460 RepID=UPI003C70F9CA
MPEDGAVNTSATPQNDPDAPHRTLLSEVDVRGVEAVDALSRLFAEEKRRGARPAIFNSAL